MAHLDESRILSALARLSEKTAKADRCIDLYIYGGAVLVLDGGFRNVTNDIDVTVVDTDDLLFLRDAAEEVGQEPQRRFPKKWIESGDVLLGMIPSREKYFHPLAGFGARQNNGLRIFLLNHAPQLAMKMIRWFPTEKDCQDMRDLCERLECNTKSALSDIWQAHVSLLPRGFTEHVTQKTINNLWDTLAIRTRRPTQPTAPCISAENLAL